MGERADGLSDDLLESENQDGALDNQDSAGADVLRQAELVLIKGKLFNRVEELSKRFSRFTFLELIAFCGIDANDKTPGNFRKYCKYVDAFNMLLSEGKIVKDLSRDGGSTEMFYKIRTLH